MNNNKKRIIIVVSICLLVTILGGITYAWFNYSSETNEQEIIAGDIYLKLTEGEDELELSNIFPETAEEARARDDNYITFEVSGINTSNKTIYYEFILDHGDEKSSPKTRFNDEDLRIDLVEINGNNETYLLSAASYETLVNRRIYVNTINANTITEVEKHYLLRMWLDENVSISDVLASANYTTYDFPNKYATIKLIVAGDFEEKEAAKTLYTIMRETAVMDNISSTYVSSNTGINFGEVSSDTNGKGVYTRAGTENDTYPILYYRGAVDNNNVVFANKCWKAVRTTDTGGVKLIYNGVSSELYEEIPLAESSYTKDTTNTDSRWTFDSSDSTWNISIEDNTQPAIEFTVPQGDNYTLVMTGTSGSSCGGQFSFYKNGTSVISGINGGGAPMDLIHAFGTLTATDVIKMNYAGSSSSTCAITFKLKMVGQGEKIADNSCNNTGTDTQISLSGTTTFAFNTSNNSPAYNGYMFGTVYTYSSSNWTSNAKFGSSFTWDGTNYKLVDATVTTPNATHHYSCNSTDAEATCTDLRYVYYASGSTKYYVTLTGGDGIEEAMTKMQTNTNDSNAKEKIDTWYASNLTSYTNKLEDTIWCNDRSMGDGNNNGWIANGGDLSTYLYYGATQRSNYADNTSTVKNQPNLACANKNDRFTVNNGNGNQALTYPVAMITEDEVVLAGGLAGKQNTTFYLNNGSYYWSLSPYVFFIDTALEFYVSSGNVGSDYVDGTNGLRPAVSLKPGTVVSSGTGTVTDPYVIE